MPTCCPRCVKPPNSCCAIMMVSSRHCANGGLAELRNMAASVSEKLYGFPAAPLLRRAWSYAQLMRLDRPIGILLLLWPTLWALWIAARALHATATTAATAAATETAGRFGPLPSI